MQFLSPAVHPLHRHENASPLNPEQGYGHETFVIGIGASASSSSVFNASHGPADAQLLIDVPCVVFPAAAAASVDEAQSALVKHAPSSSSSSPFVVFFDPPSVSALSADAIIVFKRAGAVAIAASTPKQHLRVHHEGSDTPCRPALPLLLGLDCCLSSCRLSSDHRLFVLPLRFSHFSHNHVPATVFCCSTRDKCAEGMTIALKWDCTQRLVSTSPLFPGPGAQIPLLMTCPARKNNQQCDDSDGADVFLLSEDVGTHMDAARHFYSDLTSISDYAAPQLAMMPAVIVDISERAAADPDATVTVEDLQNWECEAGCKIRAGSLVCMRSGWGEKFAVAEQYINSMRFPGFSNEAAKWLVMERPDFGGLGVDTLSVDAGNNATFDVHSVVLKSGKYFHVENMVLPNERLTPKAQRHLYFIVGPLRIIAAYEAPARVVLVEMK